MLKKTPVLYVYRGTQLQRSESPTTIPPGKRVNARQINSCTEDASYLESYLLLLGNVISSVRQADRQTKRKTETDTGRQTDRWSVQNTILSHKLKWSAPFLLPSSNNMEQTPRFYSSRILCRFHQIFLGNLSLFENVFFTHPALRRWCVSR